VGNGILILIKEIGWLDRRERLLVEVVLESSNVETSLNEDKFRVYQTGRSLIIDNSRSADLESFPKHLRSTENDLILKVRSCKGVRRSPS
jgi:hypothetical protein